MLGNRMERGDREGRPLQEALPEARVVVGKHSHCQAQPWRSQVTETAQYTRKRLTPATHTFMVVLGGFWPLIVIVGMGLGLLWASALANSP